MHQGPRKGWRDEDNTKGARTFPRSRLLLLTTMYFLALFSFLCLAVIVRAAAIVPREKRSSQDSNMSPKRLGPCSLGVFLGSGALHLLAGVEASDARRRQAGIRVKLLHLYLLLTSHDIHPERM
jgi:hypothetical protein